MSGKYFPSNSVGYLAASTANIQRGPFEIPLPIIQKRAVSSGYQCNSWGLWELLVSPATCGLGALGFGASMAVPEPGAGAVVCLGRAVVPAACPGPGAAAGSSGAVLGGAALLGSWGRQGACWSSSGTASALLHSFMGLVFQPIPEPSVNQSRVANSPYSGQRNPLHFWAICLCFSCLKRSLNAHFGGVLYFFKFLSGLSGRSLWTLFLWIVSIELWDLWTVFMVIYFMSAILK